MPYKKRGFTLVELSIVLVIIGLLIGGILIGESLMGSAKINAQIRQLQQFDIATNNFKSKYRGLPGDTKNIAHEACSGGDGNGFIDSQWCGADPLMTYWFGSTEASNYFYQLTSLGLLKTTRNGGLPYNRIWGAGTNVYVDEQFPKSKLDNKIGIIALGRPEWGKNYYYFNRDGKARHQMGYTNGSGDIRITGADALVLDQKIDDSLPLTGKVLSTNYVAGSPGWIPYGITFAGYSNCDNGTNYKTTSAAICMIAVEMFASSGN